MKYQNAQYIDFIRAKNIFLNAVQNFHLNHIQNNFNMKQCFYVLVI